MMGERLCVKLSYLVSCREENHIAVLLNWIQIVTEPSKLWGILTCFHSYTSASTKEIFHLRADHMLCLLPGRVSYYPAPPASTLHLGHSSEQEGTVQGHLGAGKCLGTLPNLPQVPALL